MINILGSSVFIVVIVGVYFYIKNKSEQSKKIPFKIRYEKK
ncbi:hypothetical protein [Arcobacter sp. KX21116]